MPKDSLHLDKVNNTLEILFCTDRNLNGHRVGTQNVLHLLYGLEEIGARTVHLVHITDTRHIVFVGLTPHSLRLGLNTVSSRVSGDGSVENAQ